MPAGNGEGPELERLRRQVAGGNPAELDQWLVRPQQGVAYHEGTVVPIVGLPVRQLPSGLLVAGSGAADGPAPIDQFGVYLTASEVLDGPLSQGDLELLLGGHGARGIVRACAALLHAGHNASGGSDLERRVLSDVLSNEVAQRAVNLLREGNRWLIAPQLMLLASGAATLELPWEVHEPDEERPDFHPTSVAVALALHVGDLLEAAARDNSDDDEVIFGNVRAGLAADVVANQMFNASSNLLLDIARHERIWHHIADEIAEDEGYANLRTVFEEAVGVPMGVFEAVGFGLYAATQREPLASKGWFDTTDVAAPQVQAVVSRTSYASNELRARLERDLDDDLCGNRWQLDAYAERPLVDFGEGGWLVHSPQLLVDRFFSGLAFFDALVAAGADEQQVRNAWGRATEKYGHEVLSSLAPSAAGQRIWTETELESAYGREGQRIADAVIDYGDRWVVVDFSSRRATRDLAHAHVDALYHEIDMLVGDKAEQLDATIAALVEDESALTGRDASRDRRFFPVIVVHSRWPTNPITVELARKKVEERGLLSGPSTALIEIATIEELEIVEAIQEEGGPNLAALLARKAEGGLRRMGLKDHILRAERLNPGPARRIDALYRSAMDRMVETFGFPEDEFHRRRSR